MYCVALMKTTEIEIVPEWKLTPKHHLALRKLLSVCFPEFLSSRIYFKQLPQFRLLAWRGEELVAQVGIEHRVINVSGTPFRIFGVIDLCCHPDSRRQGFGSSLLQHLEGMARTQEIDFVILFADDHQLYEREGFKRVGNDCKWLGIDEHKTLGILEENMSNCMMVKPIGSADWPSGLVDMMGYLF
jgi:GNAT superfamily N-acetyltransferase